jgi:hypothetical protein
MDTSQYFNSDWELDSRNDLLRAYQPTEGNQRIIRRLLTAPGQYVWHPTYGAGVGAFIGKGLSDKDANKLKATINAQIYQEPFVAQSPPAKITLQRSDNGLLCVIQYYNLVKEDYEVVNFTIQGDD